MFDIERCKFRFLRCWVNKPILEISAPTYVWAHMRSIQTACLLRFHKAVHGWGINVFHWLATDKYWVFQEFFLLEVSSDHHRALSKCIQRNMCWRYEAHLLSFQVLWTPKRVPLWTPNIQDRRFDLNTPSLWFQIWSKRIRPLLSRSWSFRQENEDRSFNERSLVPFLCEKNLLETVLHVEVKVISCLVSIKFLYIRRSLKHFKDSLHNSS